MCDTQHNSLLSKEALIISNFYAGVQGYADDLLFLCPSRTGLQEMVDIASKYAAEHRISFSTNSDPTKSKTKGIIFSERKLKFSPVPIMLNGDPLPWVEKAKYLGSKMTSILDGYSADVREKRAQFIGRNCDLNQEFSSAHPEVKTKINQIYNSSFPGSVLWDLSSPGTQAITNSWSVAVKHMWGLPHSAHRYLVEKLGGTHAKTMLMLRYIKFIQSIKKSPKLAVQFLYQKIHRNTNTITGRNIAYILNATGYTQMEDVNITKVKNTIKFAETTEDNSWKIEFLKEIVNIKHNVLVLKDDEEVTFENDDFDYIIDYLESR